MIEHIAERPRCAVFALPGSGKTSGALTALQGIHLLDQAPGLIIVPNGVLKDRT